MLNQQLAYLSIVWPLMKYASGVYMWDMHVYMNVLEKILKRAARWITGCYDRYSSVTNMLTYLNGLP